MEFSGASCITPFRQFHNRETQGEFMTGSDLGREGPDSRICGGMSAMSAPGWPRRWRVAIA